MLKIKKISEVLGRRAYTDSGEYFGDIEEANLVENKVEGWKIRMASDMAVLLGGARGVIIPHQFVRAVGDIFIISKSALPIREETLEETESESRLDDKPTAAELI